MRVAQTFFFFGNKTKQVEEQKMSDPAPIAQSSAVVCILQTAVLVILFLCEAGSFGAPLVAPGNGHAYGEPWVHLFPGFGRVCQDDYGLRDCELYNTATWGTHGCVVAAQISNSILVLKVIAMSVNLIVLGIGILEHFRALDTLPSLNQFSIIQAKYKSIAHLALVEAVLLWISVGLFVVMIILNSLLFTDPGSCPDGMFGAKNMWEYYATNRGITNINRYTHTPGEAQVPGAHYALYIVLVCLLFLLTCMRSAVAGMRWNAYASLSDEEGHLQVKKTSDPEPIYGAAQPYDPVQ